MTEKIKNISIIVLVILLIIFLFRSCSLASKVSDMEKDSDRMISNIEALNAKLVQYRTKDSMNAAKIQVLNLTLEERSKLIDKYEKDAISQAHTNIKYTDEIHFDEPMFLHDTTIVTKFEKSYIKFGFRDTTNFLFEQDLFVEANVIDKNNKKYIEFKTDMPNVTFHDQGGYVICEDTRKYRKRLGYGFGMHIGYGYDFVNQSFGPNISLGFGLNFTPKKWQYGK